MDPKNDAAALSGPKHFYRDLSPQKCAHTGSYERAMITTQWKVPVL